MYDLNGKAYKHRPTAQLGAKELVASASESDVGIDDKPVLPQSAPSCTRARQLYSIFKSPLEKNVYEVRPPLDNKA